MLAIPPGFASPVWPAAGVALAFALIWGYRTLPGVALGSFSINVLIGIQGGAPGFVEAAPVALTIAVGAVLQTGASMLIVRRLTGRGPWRLESLSEIGAILVGGGLIGCMINSTIGPLALLQAGILPATELANNWLTWWVGDTIGVIVVAPILLLLANPDTTLKRRLSVAVPLGGVTVMAIVFFLFAREAGTERSRQDFAHLAHDTHSEIQARITQAEVLTANMRAFFDAVSGAQGESWNRYAIDMLGRADLPVTVNILDLDTGDTVFQAGSPSSADLTAARPDEALRQEVVQTADRTGRVAGGVDFDGERAWIYSIAEGHSPPRAVELGFDFAALVTESDQLGLSFSDSAQQDFGARGLAAGAVHVWTARLEIGHSEVFVRYEPKKQFHIARADWEAWSALTGGLLITGLIGAMLLMVTGRTELVERLVEEKALALARTTTRLGLVLDHAGEGIVGIGGDGRILFANREAERLTGGEVEPNPTGQDVPDFLGYHPDGSRIAEGKTGFEQARKLGQSVTMETEMFRRCDGRFFPVEYTAAPVPDETGDGPGMVIIFRDISARKAADEQRERLVRDLEVSNEELEKFALVASHDLQEPLRMVASFSELLKRRYVDQLDEKGREFVHRSVEASARMQALIADLLAYARLDQEPSEPEDLEMNEVYDAVIASLQPMIRAESAEVSRDRLPRLTGNRIQLTRLVQNLISNAIKYAAPDREPRIHVSAIREGDEWQIAVSDNGIGIDAAFRDSVFEPFRRLHGRGATEGAGLGLAICRKIVEQASGRIWVAGNAPHGCVITFALPAKVAAETAGRSH